MSKVTTTIRNSSGPMPATYGLISIDIVKEVNRIPHAQLVLLDGNVAKQRFFISDSSFFEPGKEIEILLRYEGDPSQGTSVFKGLVIKQVVEASAEGTLLTVEMKDAAIQLAQSRRSAVYQNKSDDQIVSDLIDQANQTTNNVKLEIERFQASQPLPIHPQIVQYYCTDWDFIVSRAEACGLLVIAENGKISLKEITLNGKPVQPEAAEAPSNQEPNSGEQANPSPKAGVAKNHIFNFGVSQIYNLEMEVDASHQRASVESIAWDLKNKKLIKAGTTKEFTLSQGNLNAGDLAKAVGGKREVLSSPVPLAEKMLQTWADAVMLRSRMAMIRGRIAVPGFGDIHHMDVIKVAGVGKRFNGTTLVTGVRHRVDPKGWRTDVQFGLSPERFAAKRDIVDIPAAGLLPSVNGLQIGVVDKFAEDEDKEFRVKIILPGIDEKDGTVWARLASPDAGKDRGYFFRPEPGDEVVVGFFNDDPRQAVILGAMYGSKNKPPQSVSQLTKDNVEKGIVTKKGTILGFTDKDKPSVFVQTPKSNTIIFDDDKEMIQITDQHGNSIKMNKDGIEIKSAKDLKIKASGKIEITGQKVDVK